MSPEEVKPYLERVVGEKLNRGLTVLEIEAQKSIKKNFEAGGRPPWPPSKKRSGKTLIVSGNLSNVLTVRSEADRSVTLITNPLARAYARIHQEGGTIHRPARPLKFRQKKYKDGRVRTVFASSKHKKITKVTMTKAYTITIPPRPYMVIPMEDLNTMARLIEQA